MRRSRAASLKRVAHAIAFVFAATVTLHAQASVHPPASAPSFREVTDETGRAIRIPQTIRRIVSLAPSLTETVYALGIQDRLVGDTDYCDFPPDARKKPKVGGVINPSIETIASLHPDLVLVTKVNRMETVNGLETLGIPSYASDPQSVTGVFASIQRLSEILGVPDAGSALTKDLERRVNALQQCVGSFPARRVLFVVWTEPLISVGKQTFIADAIARAGGVSVVDTSQSWPQVNLEEVVRLQPEFLVFAESYSQTSLHGINALVELPGWRVLDAVQHHRFVVVSNAIDRPGPRIVSAIEDLARQLHPEAFDEKTPASMNVAPALYAAHQPAGVPIGGRVPGDSRIQFDRARQSTEATACVR